MSRYIEADDLKKTIDREIFRHDTIDHVFQIIDDAPSIDIDRCKKCKYNPKDIQRNCDTCKNRDIEGWRNPCLGCIGFVFYEPKEKD